MCFIVVFDIVRIGIEPEDGKVGTQASSWKENIFMLSDHIRWSDYVHILIIG